MSEDDQKPASTVAVGVSNVVWLSDPEFAHVLLILFTIDETKPECNRCKKAKLKCGGYPSITIIQYEGSKATRDPFRCQDTSEKLTVLAPYARSCIDNQVQGTNISLHHWISTPQDEIFTSYTISHLLSGQDQEAHVITGSSYSIASKCFLALCTTYFGSEHMEASLIQRGLQRYGCALEQLNKALGDPARRHSLDVLEAITVMVVLEVSNFDFVSIRALFIKRYHARV